jgi:hypothetical protein
VLCYDALVELPVYHDNLRSSGSWSATLNHFKDRWTHARGLEPRLRELQVRQALLRRPVSDDLEGRLGTAASQVSEWAKDPAAQLDLDRLMQLGQMLGGGSLRSSEVAAISPFHEPAPAVILPRLVENALGWFTAQSFNEIHPVEQATLVYVRLLDLDPFGSPESDLVALFAASLFTERASLPPLIIFADDSSAYDGAIQSAFRMLTQPLVEFFAAGLMRTIELVSEG